MKVKKEEELKIKTDVKELLNLIAQLIVILFKKFKWAMAVSCLISYVVLNYDAVKELVILIFALFK